MTYAQKPFEITEDIGTTFWICQQNRISTTCLLVTDLLITDYSSDSFDFSLTGKPMLFYTPDRKNYELERSVHRSVKLNALRKVCDTFDELMRALESRNFEEEKAKKSSEENLAECDGHATNRTIDEVLLRGSQNGQDSRCRRTQENRRNMQILL